MKTELHTRNKHNKGYDFDFLIKTNKTLSSYIIKSVDGRNTIDFSNAKAVKCLNKSLLLAYYKVDFWDLPDTFLCPPIPGRADYIHEIADLLYEGLSHKTEHIKGLDIGVGANIVYPLIGHSEYGWKFVGSEVNSEAIAWGKNVLSKNPHLEKQIKIRKQKDKHSIFSNIIKKEESFDFTMCNPPFFSSQEEVQKANSRKTKNLNLKPGHNFGGVPSELWCEGGEVQFLKTMVDESEKVQTKVLWFTSLISKNTSLAQIEKQIKNNKKIRDYKVLEMAQGQKISRCIAWTFKTTKQINLWKKDWK